MADTAARAPRRWSLRNYIIGLTCLLIAAFAGGSVYTALASQSMVRDDAKAETAYAATTAAQTVAADIKALRDGIAKTAETPGMAQLFAPGAACSLSFSGVGEFHSGHLDLVDRQGKVTCSSSPDAVGTTYLQAPWFGDALQGSTLVAPFIDPASGRQVAVASEPIAGAGLLVGVIDISPLAAQLSTTLGGATHYEFMLTTADGRTALSRSVDAAKWSGRPIDQTSFERDSANTERADVDGVSRIYGAATVAGTGWHVYAGQDTAVALQAADNVARQNGMLLLGASLVIIVAILVVYRRITRPISRLEAAVRKADPSAGVEPIVVSGPREVAALAASFNALMAAVEQELSQRREAEDRLSAGLAELEIVDAQRRQLVDKLVTAQEEERRRIASDVHDDSVQLLAASIMRVSLIRQAAVDPATDAQLARLQENLEGAVDRLRHLLFQLRPPSLDREGLAAALNEYFEQWSGDANVVYSIHNRLDVELPQNTRVALFRIAQEALTNVRKHAQASSVTVTLDHHGGGVRMVIEDDGVGIDSIETDDSPIGHLGLVTMRERAELAGGWCRVHGAATHGTVVEIWMPAERPEPVAV